MATRAKDTEAALREAMARYKAMVLHERNFDPVTERYNYPHEISAADVLRMAGIKSRGTLAKPYHEKLKSDLDDLIDDLKKKTGKGKYAKPPPEEAKPPRTNRVDQLAQTIAALQYKIIALEQENAALRAEAGGKIVNLNPSGKGRKRT